MATHRNRYVKVALFEACSTRLQDAKVVGQGDDYLLLERAQPKPRQEAKRAVRKARTAKTNSQPSTVASMATHSTGHVEA